MNINNIRMVTKEHVMRRTMEMEVDGRREQAVND